MGQPLFQYSLDCPRLNVTKMEKNKVIRTDNINVENKIAWISPTTSLGRKVALYKTLFTCIGGLIHHKALLYGDTSILYVAQCDRTAVYFITSVRD